MQFNPMKILIDKSGKQAAAEIATDFIGVVITMLLWNWLVPDIFGLQRINFWQAAGLCILSALLFRSWSSSSGK